MPSTFSLMDANLPTLKQNGDPEEQIYEIVNFLTIMAETLKYALNNLDTTNFNSTALSDYSEETTGDIRRAAQTLAAEQKKLSTSIGQLTGSVTKLAEKTAAIEETLDKLVPLLAGQLAFISTENTSITIGGDGKTVNINGDVFINGTRK